MLIGYPYETATLLAVCCIEGLPDKLMQSSAAQQFVLVRRKHLRLRQKRSRPVVHHQGALGGAFRWSLFHWKQRRDRTAASVVAPTKISKPPEGSGTGGEERV